MESYVCRTLSLLYPRVRAIQPPPGVVAYPGNYTCITQPNSSTMNVDTYLRSFVCTPTTHLRSFPMSHSRCITIRVRDSRMSGGCMVELRSGPKNQARPCPSPCTLCPSPARPDTLTGIMSPSPISTRHFFNPWAVITDVLNYNSELFELQKSV